MAENTSNSSLEKRIKKHVIGKPHRFMAVAPLGFETTLTEELRYIGVDCAMGAANSAEEDCTAGIKVAGDGKVEFTAKLTEAWKAVAYSRIANRILMEIGTFKAENFSQLEKGAANIPWELYLSARPVFHTTCKHSRLYHSDAVEERVLKVINKVIEPAEMQCKVVEPAEMQTKVIEPAEMHNDVIPDLIGDLTVPAKKMQQHLYINLQDDRCILWLDLAGEELYKRGHERFVAEAPLKETIAAAMIFEAAKLTTNHQPLTTILDGMAGSGTFSLEAAYIANGLIPGKCRDFALKHQPAFKEGTWNFILKGANVIASDDIAKQSEQNRPAVTIITSDISERPIGIIRHNAESSPLPAGAIYPQLKDFFSYTIEDFTKACPDNRDIIILLNPPYGKRLSFDAPKLYLKIGQQLTRWSRDAQSRNINLTVAILSPKDDTRGGLHYNCTENLQKACPPLDPKKNKSAKLIATSHGGFSLNAIFARI